MTYYTRVLQLINQNDLSKPFTYTFLFYYIANDKRSSEFYNEH